MGKKPASLWADKAEPSEDVLADVTIRKPPTEELVALVSRAVAQALEEYDAEIFELDKEMTTWDRWFVRK